MNLCGNVEETKTFLKTTSAWRESLELIIRRVSYSCGSKHAVLCFLSFFHHIPFMFSLCQFFPDHLHGPCSATSLTALFALSCCRKILQPVCGSLLWGWMPDRKEKGSHNGKRRKKQGTFLSNWRQRNRDCRAHGVEEELEAMGFSSASLRREWEKSTVIGYVSIKSNMNVQLSWCMREWEHPGLCYRWREFPSLCLQHI